MSSLLGTIAVLAMPLLAVDANDPMTGTAWAQYILPHCEDLVPAHVQTKWGLRPIPLERNPDVYSMFTCRFQRGEQQVDATYGCGNRKLEIPKKLHPGAGSMQVADLGRFATSHIDAKRGEVVLDVYDDDTPCEISLGWPDPNGIEMAKRLMTDLLSAATPSVVGKSRLEAIYLDPQSAPGRAFLTSADAWKQEAAGLAGDVVLPVGYPRIVDGGTLPDLPGGKVALVGLCPIGSGRVVANSTRLALPGLRRALVDSPRSALACPVSIRQ